MDFRRIEYFIEVAKELSFSKASKQLHISHQALSSQIQKLEEELGVKLFERSIPNILLTDVGKRLFDAFCPVVTEAHEAYTQIENYVNYRKHTLSISYFNALSYDRILEPLVQFIKKSKQDLDVDVTALSIEDARDTFMEDESDLLVTVMMDPGEWQTVTWHSVMHFPLRIIVSEHHPWYSKEIITEADIKQGSLLYYKTGSPAFLKDLNTRDRISMKNFDTYMARLVKGQEFGVVADIYSRREGNFKLFDMPESCRAYADIIVAYKKEHPLAYMLKGLEHFQL